jgi:hypothetical protein
MIDDLAQNWLDAKEAEAVAVARRRELEDKLTSLIGVAENMEGTENVKTDSGYKIKITGRVNRKVDGKRIQEIAAEEGLVEHLSSLFRWKPEINMTVWKSADKSITEPLLGGITTQPGRASFTIIKE